MKLTTHAQVRMAERGISRLDVHRAITNGHRWMSKDRTIVFEFGSVRAVVDPIKPAVITVIRVEGDICAN